MRFGSILPWLTLHWADILALFTSMLETCSPARAEKSWFMVARCESNNSKRGQSAEKHQEFKTGGNFFRSKSKYQSVPFGGWEGARLRHKFSLLDAKRPFISILLLVHVFLRSLSHRVEKRPRVHSETSNVSQRVHWIHLFQNALLSSSNG